MSRHSVRRKARQSSSVILSPRSSLLAMLGLLACACGDSGTGANGGSGGEAGGGGEGGAGGQAGVSERRMFVTSAFRSGDFGGIAGADELCATEAEEANLEGDFKAWLSTVSSSVVERLAPVDDTAYVLVDGTMLAMDWADLLDGSIAAPINLDAKGVRRSGDVWTGTRATGASYAADDCEGFTSGMAGDMGLCGTTGSTGSSWTENMIPRCSTQLRLYCIEQ